MPAAVVDRPGGVRQRAGIISRIMLAELSRYCSKIELVGGMRLGIRSETVKIMACPADDESEKLMVSMLLFRSSGEGRLPVSDPKVLSGRWSPSNGGAPVPYEVLIADRYRWGVLELYHTGPAEFVAAVESRAGKKGMTFRWERGVCLSERRGLISGTVFAQEMSFPNEDSLFRAIGMDFVLPEHRVAYCNPSRRTGRRRRATAWHE